MRKKRHKKTLVKSISCSLFLILSSFQASYATPNGNVIPANDKEYITSEINQKSTVINGLVKDKQGEPLIGVSITVKGTSNGSLTDLDGKFSIDVPNANSTLVISYIGFRSQEITLGGKSNIDVILVEDVQMLEDVVVVGYGTMDKKELTSAISHISGDKLLNIGAMDPAMTLQGKVPGVSITNTQSGNPNAGASIQIRGVSSRSAGLGPLIVIDGVPGGNLQNINVNDIASIDVLKDGAASAIYGTRGSNGVILVTTKKGSMDGKVRTEYNGFVSINMAHNDLDVLNAEEFRKYKVNSGMAQDFGASVDWMKEVTRTGYTQNHALTLSGGTAKSNYRLTMDVKDAKGIDLATDRFEYGARLGFDHTTNSGLLKFSGNITPRIIKRSNTDEKIFTQAMTANPTIPIKNANDATGKSYTQFTGDGMWNPLDRANLYKDQNEHKNLEWNITTKLNLLPLLAKEGYSDHRLSTQVTIAQQFNDNQYFKFIPSYSTLTEAYTLKSLTGYGEAEQKLDKNKNETFEWLANYNFEKNNHNLGVMVGYSYQQFMNYGFSAENKKFTSDALTWDNLGDGEYMKEAGRNGMGSYRNSSKLAAFFGRVNYSYKDRYLMTASLRYEGSSKFGVNNKWGYFPAVSAGWRISSESFMADIKWIDDLKVRGDFGITGNQSFDSYKSLTTYGGYGDVYYNGQYYKGWGANKNPNPDLKWEKNVNWNVGVDFALFKKLSGSFNYYSREPRDLLGDYNVSVPPYLWDEMFVNVGTMRNTGVEIELNYQAVRTKDFTYDIGFAGATLNNKFVEFSNQTYTGQDYYELVGMEAPGAPGNLQRISKGERIGTYYTYRYAGIDNDGDWLIYNKNNDIIPIGQAVDADKAPTGNGLPKFTASLNNTFTYKKFDLSLYFRGAFGFDLFNVHDFYYSLPNVYGPYNVLTKTFKENSNITQGQNQLLDYFIEKGDYLKLDVLTLGYTLNMKSRWVERIRLYGTVNNVFTLTKFSGIDPSQYPVNGMTPGALTKPAPNASDGTKLYYPSTTSILFGAQISF